MSATSPVSFWIIAVAGSVALHGAIGMALYAMPMPESKPPNRTEIDIATLAKGGAQQIATPENVSVIEVGRPALVVQPPASVLAAQDDSNVAEPARAEPDEMVAAAASADAEPVSDKPTAIRPSEEAVAAPAPTETASQAVLANPVETLSQSSPASETLQAVAALESDVPEDVAASAPVAPADTAAPAVPSAILPDRPEATTAPSPITGTTVESLIAAAGPETAEPLPSAVPQVTAPVQETLEAVASVEVTTPSIAGGGAAASVVTPTPSGAPTSSAPVAVQARPATVAVGSDPAAPIGSGPAAVIGGTSAVAVSPVVAAPVVAAPVVAAPAVTKPSSGAADEMVATGSALATPGPSPIAPAVIAPTANEAAAAAQVAMVTPRPDVLSDGGASDGATSGTLRVAEFLAARRGDDCLLALPTSISPTQASIQAFTAAPDTVGRLGSEYERISGLKLQTDTRIVSKDQCGALVFAKSLAQYPNFPLRVTLDQAIIESGRALSGVVSGLRKDTLYLMVIDDEGNAKLVDSYANLQAALANFNAPMTLTSGPVASVQLLVAIASDGPLQTVPTRVGLPAEEYFSRLATEIITDNRSIAYGITSFAVR